MNKFIEIIQFIPKLLNQYSLSYKNIIILFGILLIAFLFTFHLFYKLIHIIIRAKNKATSELLYLKYSLPGDNRKEINKR